MTTQFNYLQELRREFIAAHGEPPVYNVSKHYSPTKGFEDLNAPDPKRREVLEKVRPYVRKAQIFAIKAVRRVDFRKARRAGFIVILARRYNLQENNLEMMERIDEIIVDYITCTILDFTEAKRDHAICHTINRGLQEKERLVDVGEGLKDFITPVKRKREG